VSALAAVVVTVRNEPIPRLRTLVRRLVGQEGVEPFEVLIAATPTEARAIDDDAELQALVPAGAVAAVRAVPNPSGGRSAGLNRAIWTADAEIIVRIDARTRPSADHVARSIARLQADPGVGVVGGVQHPVASSDDDVARGIARALSNPYLTGGAAYRRGAAGPVDTVYLGAYRKAELLALGGFDERMEPNEDFEMCARYRDAGATIWLEPGLVADYEPRDELGAVWRQYQAFGRSKVRMWRLTGRRPAPRQVVPIAAAAGGVIGAVAVARRPVLAAPAVALGAAALAVAAEVGAPPATVARERLWSLATYPVLIGGWIVGAAREAVRESPAVR
jgi:hypothetical protein